MNVFCFETGFEVDDQFFFFCLNLRKFKLDSEDWVRSRSRIQPVREPKDTHTNAERRGRSIPWEKKKKKKGRVDQEKKKGATVRVRVTVIMRFKTRLVSKVLLMVV